MNDTTSRLCLRPVLWLTLTAFVAAQSLADVTTAIDQQPMSLVANKAGALYEKTIEMLPLLAIAFVLVLVFWLLAKVVGRADRLFCRVSQNQFIQDFVRQIVQAAIFIVGVLLALDLLEATALVGAVLGTAGVVGLAVGFAFKDVVENYLAGILLSLRQPFLPNDHIKVDGFEGKVIRMTSRATILLTFDGNHVRIPNATVFKSTMTNFSRNPLRRFQFALGVGCDQDLANAQKIGLEVLQRMNSVLDHPEPTAVIGEPGDSNIPITYYGWVDQFQASFGKTKSEAIRLVNAALNDAGVDLPEPIYRLNMAKEPPTQAQDRSTTTRTKETTPQAVQTQEQDTSVDHEIDDQIQKERSEEPHLDMLDPTAKQE